MHCLESVIVFPDNKQFEALHYEDDGEICVVTGPVAKPRNLEARDTFKRICSDLSWIDKCITLKWVARRSENDETR
jgi:hypothetical protein